MSRRRRAKLQEPVRVPTFCVAAQKVAHQSKRAARSAVRQLRSKPDCLDGDLLNAYPCGGHWHIGHRAWPR